ncbi:MAG: bis(5'-nucleosyl)-tetraphosphatase (symmetrical) YqeK [Endomicrobium sp.]|jgi:predicted HD superfamily hydrolase involved in NAD metabolism|nr:bis(5'-nucleosyl)-tetraphosphatase (symmetrical) YqeK [Endomicrobium sp.]
MNIIKQKILVYLIKNLTHQRLQHSVQVAILAEDIAYNYEKIDPNKVYLAAILHDCAKCMSNTDLISFVNRYNLQIFDKDIIIKHCPNLLHSFVGSSIAKVKFQIQDEDILNAIQFHSQGRKDMSTCEKIIFISDFIAHKKNKLEILKLINSAKDNLNLTFMNVLISKIKYNLRRHFYLSNQIIDTWNWYIQN